MSIRFEVCSGGNSPGTVAAEAVETRVFGERFSNSAAELRSLYRPYEQQTTLVVAWQRASPVGMVRLQLPGRLRSKSLQDAEAEPFLVDVAAAMKLANLTEAQVVDILTIASVGPPGVARGLLAKACQVASLAGCTHFVAIIDEAVLMYARGLGLRIDALGGAEPRSYLGSPASVPVLLAVDSASTALGEPRE
jgi:hypothetical protein